MLYREDVYILFDTSMVVLFESVTSDSRISCNSSYGTFKTCQQPVKRTVRHALIILQSSPFFQRTNKMSANKHTHLTLCLLSQKSGTFEVSVPSPLPGTEIRFELPAKFGVGRSKLGGPGAYIPRDKRSMFFLKMVNGDFFFDLSLDIMSLNGTKTQRHKTVLRSLNSTHACCTCNTHWEVPANEKFAVVVDEEKEEGTSPYRKRPVQCAVMNSTKRRPKFMPTSSTSEPATSNAR